MEKKSKPPMSAGSLIEAFQTAVTKYGSPNTERNARFSPYVFPESDKTTRHFQSLAHELAKAVIAGEGEAHPELKTIAKEFKGYGNGPNWQSTQMLGNAIVSGLSKENLLPGQTVPAERRNPFVGMDLG
jgi:hypothetical protein